MANIASLEQMQQFTKGFESFASSQKDLVAQAYLGREVVIKDGSDQISGVVDSVEKSDDGSIAVVVGGKGYDPVNISKVSIPTPQL